MKRSLITATILLVVLTGPLSADEEIAATFTYTDPNATSVEVAGEFSNWKTIPLTKNDAGVWTKTVYLKPGHYGYKFVVNGEWVFDPKNPARKTVNDIENSLITVGAVPAAAATGAGETVFSYRDTSAQTVHVAGEFNRWLDNVDGKVTGKTEWMMQNDGAGNWTFSTTLPPGRHKFKYVINGGERWAQDPNLPASTDGNSIIEVKAGASATPTGAAPAAARGTTFTYADPGAKSVSVAGQFNNWNTTANPMKKDEAGIWTTSIPLKPGKYQYKLVVDGDWRQDPTNPDSVDDGGGNINSVITVAP